MKNFNTQSLGLVMMLMLMLIAMISTAPLPEKEVLLLKRIQEIANDTAQKALDEWVIKASGSNGEQKCVKENNQTVFFCLAEKSLNHTKNTSVYKSTKELRHQLHHYNSLTGIVNCHLRKTHEQKLKDFLEDIMHCVDYELMNKTIT